MLEEQMSRYKPQTAVADPCPFGATCESREVKQRIERAGGRNVEIEIDSAKAVEYEKAERVGTLDGVGVGIVDGEVGGIGFFHKLVCYVVRP